MLDVRKMLYSYKKLEVGLQNIERSIAHLHTVKEFPSCVASYSDMPKGSGNTSSTERYAIKNIQEQDLTEKRLEGLTRDKEAYEESIQLIRSALSTLTTEESEVIRLRYFQGYRMRKVASVLERSERLVHYVHTNALQAIGQCLNGGKLDLKLKWFEKKEKAPA